jgi:hypothetical protein
MTLEIPAGYALIAFHHTQDLALHPQVTTLGAFVELFSGGPDELAETCGGAWSDNIVPSMSDDVAFLECTVKLGPNDTGPTGASSFSATGGNVGTSLAPQVSFLVKKRTASGGKANRGRMFVPGPTEADVNSGGVVTGGVVDALQGAFGDFFSDLVAADIAPVILHAISEAVPDPPAPTIITEFQVDSVVATQRRRLRG